MLEIRKTDLEKLLKYPIRSQDGKGKEAEIVLKIFNPHGRGSWYVLEAQQMPDGDLYCFGYVESPITPLFDEYGYFTLNQLREVQVPIQIEDVGTGEIHVLGYCSLEVDRTLEEGAKMKKVLN
jgi:hypothetical protein